MSGVVWGHFLWDPGNLKKWGYSIWKKTKTRHGTIVNLRKMRSKRCILFVSENVKANAVFYSLFSTQKEYTYRTYRAHRTPHTTSHIYCRYGTTTAVSNGRFFLKIWKSGQGNVPHFFCPTQAMSPASSILRFPVVWENGCAPPSSEIFRKKRPF
jgi:hypothetical protein